MTKAYVEDYRFYAKHLNIYEADTLALLDSATPICMSDFELNFIQPIEEDYCFSGYTHRICADQSRFNRPRP